MYVKKKSESSLWFLSSLLSNMNAVAQYLKLDYPHFSIGPVLDPNLGITHASKLGLITRGMKKGGKIKVSA